MTPASAPAINPPRWLDLLLVLIGPALLAAGLDQFNGAFSSTLLGLLVGGVLAVVAHRWSRVAKPVLLFLSIISLVYGIIFALYTLGLPPALVSLWGSVAFLVGALGLSHRLSSTRRPVGYILLASLAVIMVLFFLILWPPRGRTILLTLPILPPTESPQVTADAGGIWAAYWTAPQMTKTDALTLVKGPLEADGWTMVDTSVYGLGFPLVSAWRGAYSLEILYVTDAPRDYWSTGAYMAAYLRRGPARLFVEPDSGR